MQDLSPNLIAEGVSLMALCTLAIALRFWSRALLPTRKFQADDWTALGAWVHFFSQRRRAMAFSIAKQTA